MAPRESRKGDLIVVVPGVDSPLLLGEICGTMKLYYQIEGEAFVYGVMDGALVGEDTRLITLEAR